MTRYPIFGSAQPVDPMPNEPVQGPADKPTEPASFVENPPANGAPALEPHDLEAALQLLVERAQYITGATGAALALAQGAAMVCRASAGSCAPPVGARLQVQSGLTGESVARKQLLRCDNAENDPRVNLETCLQLGIASIVVLPLLSKSGEVRGLFELFSDHAYAFEERDLIALERMAELTGTALDLAEKTALVIPPRAPAQAAPPASADDASRKNAGLVPGPGAVASAPLSSSQDRPKSTNVEQKATSGNLTGTDFKNLELDKSEPQGRKPATFGALSDTAASLDPSQPKPGLPGTAAVPSHKPIYGANSNETQQAASLPVDFVAPAISPVPEAMQRIQKCASCGFPVSEGRTLCVDCEEKQRREPGRMETMPAEFVPSFGVSPSDAPGEESWLANHVNLLAILVLILSIIVAVVVFR